ncbi:uncharacterized protein LOC143299110 [Babylonia areolata]|uniref:uncharacterized protein LOC143299110 n=1 Tax=Babylonia areolata TaxID=304850 RepID=UPI003FD0DBA5
MKQPCQGLPPSALHSSGSAVPQECFAPLYHGPSDSHAAVRCTTSSASAMFCDLDEGLLSRADSLALLDMDRGDSATQQLLKPHDFYRHTPPHFALGATGGGDGPECTPVSHMSSSSATMGAHPVFLPNEGDPVFETLGSPGMCAGSSAVDHAAHHGYFPHGMVMTTTTTSSSSSSLTAHNLNGYSTQGHDPISSSSSSPAFSSSSSSSHPVVVNSHLSLPQNHHHPPPTAMHPFLHHHNNQHHPHHPSQHPYDSDCDPLELERFAERFKQRRIKLGVTQADVGSALADLKIPGVGSLSQSTICRFESLTLSYNNMIALKPILLAWLEEAELRAYEAKAQQQQQQQQQMEEKKRKRTSITAPEKRSLEAYFAVQPRPSGDKIAQIAERLDLRKNVVRVWFCNQRQKQKRLKFSAAAAGHH